MERFNEPTLNKHIFKRDAFQPQSITYICSKYMYQYLQLALHQIHTFLNEQRIYVCKRIAYLADTETDNCSKEGGDLAML